jgi:tetratricopeptide (TPR) repeat protein
MPFRRRLRTLALVGCIAGVAAPSVAVADETSAANVAAARRHFEKARAYYGQGAYREAVNELEAARILDPNAKDLVFNLGVVHEKLSDIDEALKWFRLYTTMDLVPQERDRADAYIRRLEGAKREIEEKQAAQQQPQTEPGPAPVEPTVRPVAPSIPHLPATQLPAAPQPSPRAPSGVGRIDGLTLGAAGVATAALAFGVIMAVKAEKDQPPANFVTGRDGSYPDLNRRVDTAFREAILADVGFGAALVSGVATAYLYFGRARATPATSGATTVSAWPAPGGGTLLVKGYF